jgi:hypothetical protein
MVSNATSTHTADLRANGGYARWAYGYEHHPIAIRFNCVQIGWHTVFKKPRAVTVQSLLTIEQQSISRLS